MDYLIPVRTRKFYDYPEHTHEVWEILFNIEGRGTAIIDGESCPFEEGTIFCIRPGVVHKKKAEEGFRDVSIMLTDFCFQSEPENFFVFQDDERESFGTLFRLAYQYPMNPASDVFAERFLRSILDAMQNLLSHWRFAGQQNTEVLRVQKILMEHISDSDFDVSRVVAETPYSPNYFRKLFKDECGCSPLQFYHRLKIQLAKQQLVQYKDVFTVEEIARNCGFEDPYYFSRVFKKIAGVSPMQYYKRSRGALQLPPETV